MYHYASALIYCLSFKRCGDSTTTSIHDYMPIFENIELSSFKLICI